MPTRNIVLTDGQEELLDRLVASGRYQNASEAMRAGLRLLEREEMEMAALQLQLQQSLKEEEAGDLASGSGENAIRRAFARARGSAAE
jgi:antitoxin ParD1/3/4